MSSITVAEFANELKKTPEILLDQLKAAGVVKAASTDALTESDKQKLLAHLQAGHGAVAGDRKKITMVKKSTSEIKQADASGKARTIQVEVRKKRTFIQRDEPVKASAVAPSTPSAQAASAVPSAAATSTVAPTPVAAPVVVPVVAPTPENKELARREGVALGQANSIRRQEEELSEKRQARQAVEQREREAAERAAAYAAQEAQKKAQASAAKKEASREYAEEAAARAAAQAAAREKAEAESRARAEEEAARAVDLSDRRRKAEAEAAAIRSMMSTPAKVLVAKKPEEPKPAPRAAADAKKGTLHKPVVAPGPRTAAGASGAPAAGAGVGAGAGAGKEVKSAKLSSSWAGDPAKKKGIPTRGDAGGANRGGGTAWRGGPRGGGGGSGNRRGNDRNNDRNDHHSHAAPVEARTL
ncbi:MAG: translation initiation factor IF-2 associated domain-containing protein, partial [Burkholderiaceae bacterium]|nr:translation initiation factor IF-2 associated domain-containing protein [Burkholderiaceae bacterium]